MIVFDVSAVRAIFLTVAVYIGFGTPPIVIEQTRQLMFTSSDLFASRSVLGQQLSSSDFSHSLEWTLFKPKHGVCPAKSTPHWNVTSIWDGISAKGEQRFEKRETLEHVITSSIPESCPLESICTLPLCYNTSSVLVNEQQPKTEVSRLHSKEQVRNYSILASSAHTTPQHLDFELPISTDLDLQSLFSKTEMKTLQESKVQPQLDLCPQRLCAETNLSSIQDTAMVLKATLSLSSDLHTVSEQPLLDNAELVTHRASEASFQIPILDACPLDQSKETTVNHSTSLSADSPVVFLSEYQPLPGSDSGVLWYHEQLRSYLRNAILSSLPETWANWITSNRLTLGIVCVTVMYASLLWPFLFVLWRQVKAKRRMIGELSVLNGACHTKDLQLLISKRENECLMEKLTEANTHLITLEELVKSRTQELLQLNQNEALVKAELCNVSTSLSDAQDLISRQLSQINSLETEKRDHHETTSKLGSDCSHLLVRVADLTKEKESLVAENMRVKNAQEATATAMATLQAVHEQTKRELMETKVARADLESQLSSMAEKLNTNKTKLHEQEKELKELNDCLGQVTSQTAEMASLSCESLLDDDVTAVHFADCDNNVQLSSVQDVLNGFQDEIALQQSKHLIRQLKEELEKKESLIERHDIENKSLEQQVLLLQTASKISSSQMSELKLKMNGITEYFNSKEDNLHRKLMASEMKVHQLELLNSDAHKKHLMIKEELDNERINYNDSKQQLHSVIRSLQHQVHVNMTRADRAMKCTKFTEQELRQANREIVELKKRLREAASVRAYARPPPDSRPPSAPCAAAPHTTSLATTHHVSSSSRLPHVLLTRRTNNLKKAPQLNQITPANTARRAPSYPSPLLKSVGTEKKSEIPTVAGISCSLSSTTAVTATQSAPDATLISELVAGVIHEAEKENPRADSLIIEDVKQIKKSDIMSTLIASNTEPTLNHTPTVNLGVASSDQCNVQFPTGRDVDGGAPLTPKANEPSLKADIVDMEDVESGVATAATLKESGKDDHTPIQLNTYFDKTSAPTWFDLGCDQTITLFVPHCGMEKLVTKETCPQADTNLKSDIVTVIDNKATPTQEPKLFDIGVYTCDQSNALFSAPQEVDVANIAKETYPQADTNIKSDILTVSDNKTTPSQAPTLFELGVFSSDVSDAQFDPESDEEDDNGTRPKAEATLTSSVEDFSENTLTQESGVCVFDKCSTQLVPERKMYDSITSVMEADQYFRAEATLVQSSSDPELNDSATTKSPSGEKTLFELGIFSSDECY